jgi:lipopolysaccharide/colanic/teichoic acid biosynthesis glycosyltransferase
MLPIRLVNIAGSALALIVLSPLLVLVAVWLKLATSGPVFCVRERVRPNGRHFWLVKFCTHGTWLGLHLRRFSVDELPGLISVLLGEMSLSELSWK